MCLGNFEILRNIDTVKFVSGSIKDLEKAEEIIQKYDLCKRTKVYISPVFGNIDPADIVEFMKERRIKLGYSCSSINLSGIRIKKACNRKRGRNGY